MRVFTNGLVIQKGIQVTRPRRARVHGNFQAVRELKRLLETEYVKTKVSFRKEDLTASNAKRACESRIETVMSILRWVMLRARMQIVDRVPI